MPIGAFEHDATHRGSQPLRTIGTGQNAPGQSPGPYGIFDVVSPAAGRKDGLVETHQMTDDFGVRVIGQIQIRERIAGEGVRRNSKTITSGL